MKKGEKTVEQKINEENNIEVVKVSTLNETDRFLLPNMKHTKSDSYVILEKKQNAVIFYNEFTGQMYFDNGNMEVVKIKFKKLL